MTRFSLYATCVAAACPLAAVVGCGGKQDSTPAGGESRAAETAVAQGVQLATISLGHSRTSKELFDTLEQRVSVINARAGVDAAAVESRTTKRLEIRFDVDKMFFAAPPTVARAGHPVPVRLVVDHVPQSPAGEHNVQSTTYDLSAGELDKFPEYKQWAKGITLGFVAGGR